MRVAIYGIAKNEEQFAERWAEAVMPELRPGDSTLILDTGSKDRTVRKLRTSKVTVEIGLVDPWRFDDARNASLVLVDPQAEAAFAVDLDEVPQPGWRDAIEADWAEGATRLRYPYVWSWQPDGSPGVTYYGDKLHLRRGFRWKNPAHEVLKYAHGQERHAWTEGLVVHHHPDTSKSRSSYLGLIGLALEEDPTDDRMQHYYARELLFNGRNVEAVEWFERHLANPRSTWRHERSQSMLYLAQSGGNEAWEEQWIMRAVAECPERKEVWRAAARLAEARGDTDLATIYRQRADALPKDRFYLSDPE